MQKEFGKNKKFKIAFFTSHVIQYQGPFFNKMGVDPQLDLTVFFFSKSGAEEYTDREFNKKIKWDRDLLNGYNYRFLRNYSLFSGRDGFLKYMNFGVIPEILRGRYDAVVICGYSWFISWLIWFVASVFGIRILFIGETNELQHKNPTFIKKIIKGFLLKIFFSKCLALLYIGTLNKQYYLSLGVTEEKLFFWPYCVDNDFFMKEHQRLKGLVKEIKILYNLAQEKTVILFAGKLISKKRPLDLIKAFSKMHTKNNCELVFAGDGILMPGLEKYTKDNNINGVHLPGFLNQIELAKLYSVADIFTLVSDYEPWGLSLNEAMCFGIAPVVSDEVSAGYDLVKYKDNGFIFKAGDVDKLAEILDVLVSDKAMRLRMGQRSKDIISVWNYDKDIKGILDSLGFTSEKKENGK